MVLWHFHVDCGSVTNGGDKRKIVKQDLSCPRKISPETLETEANTRINWIWRKPDHFILACILGCLFWYPVCLLCLAGCSCGGEPAWSWRYRASHLSLTGICMFKSLLKHWWINKKDGGKCNGYDRISRSTTSLFETTNRKILMEFP